MSEEQQTIPAIPVVRTDDPGYRNQAAVNLATCEALERWATDAIRQLTDIQRVARQMRERCKPVELHD